MQKSFPMFREGKARASKDWLSLPIPLTSFVGREQEIATVCTLLRQPEIRLLTLIGPGGVGKTHLALQVATMLAPELDEQVCFVSLEDTNEPELVLPTIARALGVPELGSQPFLERFQASLQGKHLLLLLDNLEQVLEAAPTLAELLGVCPGLTILATSRASLRVSGEQIFAVPPLALPNLARLPEKDQLVQYSAIALFVERATTVLPAFRLTEENRRLVAEICLHLDGLPLAIELAAPRLKILSLHTLQQRLTHRFEVLTQGMRNAPGRHQTLHNNLEWSYRLLTPREQHVFRFLSVFAGGCTLPALETAWKLAGHSQEQEGLLEDMTSLLEKSMLSRETQEAEEPRLFLLRSLREYGMHRLTLTGELLQVQWAHAMSYLKLAEEAESALKGQEAHHWLQLLQREHENLREAFGFLLTRREQEESQRTEMALRLAIALERFWILAGHVQEGRNLLERALKSSQGVSASLRGQAWCLVATLALSQGDLPAVGAACQESLTLFRELGDSVGIANALSRFGFLAWMRGDPKTTRASYEEGLAIAQGELGQDVRREMLCWFASLAFFQGEAQMARRLIEESLALSREVGDQYQCARALNLLGWIAFLQGDITEARRFQQESLAASRALDNQRGMARSLSALGEIASRLGDFAQACEHYEESLSILLRLDDRWVLALSLQGLARVAGAQGEEIWAVHLWSAAQVLRRAVGMSAMVSLEQQRGQQGLTRLRERLGEQAFAAAWAAGQALSPEQAVAARYRPTSATALSPAEKQPVMKLLSPCGLHKGLTSREREVLRLVAQGLTDAKIAERLVISPRTVNFHLSSIYRKLEVSSRSAATRYAFEHRLF